MSAAAQSPAIPLLEVEDLVKHFPLASGLLRRGTGQVHAVNGVSLTVGTGETVALVGESGCGKTTVARAIARLHTIDGGRVRFKGIDLAGLSGAALKSARKAMQMVFQDPFGSLNPRLTVASIVAEPLVIHGVGTRAQRQQRVREVLAQVGLRQEDGERYPHQFSGGQRQRIAIARALVVAPELIIADEPLSALDVSIQSQILNLLSDLKTAHGLAFLFITHDLAVVDHFADRVVVMYLGHVVESAPREALFAAPRHHYTRALIDAVPVTGRGKRRLGSAAAGDVPSPIDPPPGCPFHPRCPKATELCRREMPPLAPMPGAAGVTAACHHPLEPGPLEPMPPAGGTP